MKGECIFRLYKKCKPAEHVKSVEYLSEKWIQLICGMCIKSVYAQTRRRRLVLVNTL